MLGALAPLTSPLDTPLYEVRSESKFLLAIKTSKIYIKKMFLLGHKVKVFHCFST